MNIVANTGVDAGMIMVCDAKGYSGVDTYSVPNGKYKVEWRIAETWNGSIDGEGIIEVTSGEIIVTDPCYVIGDKEWMKWLEDTNYGDNVDNAIIIDEMGGDGYYTVHLGLTKV